MCQVDTHCKGWGGGSYQALPATTKPRGDVKMWWRERPQLHSDLSKPVMTQSYLEPFATLTSRVCWVVLIHVKAVVSEASTLWSKWFQLIWPEPWLFAVKKLTSLQQQQLAYSFCLTSLQSSNLENNTKQELGLQLWRGLLLKGICLGFVLKKLCRLL